MLDFHYSLRIDRHTPATEAAAMGVAFIDLREDGIIPVNEFAVAWRQQVASQTVRGQMYTVEMHLNGVCTCDCQGYRSHFHCKHQALGKAQQAELVARGVVGVDPNGEGKAAQIAATQDAAYEVQPFRVGERVRATNPRSGRAIEGTIQRINGDMIIIRYRKGAGSLWGQVAFNMANVTPARQVA